jgi:hypothetical protein
MKGLVAMMIVVSTISSRVCATVQVMVFAVSFVARRLGFRMILCRVMLSIFPAIFFFFFARFLGVTRARVKTQSIIMPRAIASSDEEDTEVLADVAHITSPKQASGDRPSRSRLRKVVSYIENSDTDPVDEDIENENVPAKPARKALRVKASPVDSDPDINAVGKTTRQSDRAPKSSTTWQSKLTSAPCFGSPM